MYEQTPMRVHVITGGFPPGAAAGHDMDYARLRLLELVYEQPHVRATVANDLSLSRFLSGMMGLRHHHIVTGGTTHGWFAVPRATVPPAGVPGFHQSEGFV